MAHPIRDLNIRAMSLLRRRQAEPEWVSVEGRADLVSIPQDEAEEMVNVLATQSREHVDKGEIDDDTARALSMGLQLITGREPASEAVMVVAESAARFGYMARVAEWQRLTMAGSLEGWMVAGLRSAVRASVAEELEDAANEKRPFHAVLGEVTAFFVCREPLDVPYDADEGFALMWTIPGMGGEVRALLRDKTLQMALDRGGAGRDNPAHPVEGATVEDLQRVWKYGFVLRSFEEFFWED